LVAVSSPPDPALTLRLAAMVAGLVDDGYQALVHCTFGRNRSGLVATLVVRELLGLSGRDALAHVRDRRDRAVNNESFARWLSSLTAPEGQSGVRHPRSSAANQSSVSP
jgi:protein-tyrosine phosphatase